MLVGEVDAVVVGAGFAGLYALHRLRQEGFSVQCFEAAADVGGVWFWNRYPGARCDTESVYYCYTFSEDIYKKWHWPEKYSDHNDIRRYLEFVADELDLRRDIRFNTRVASAVYDEDACVWRVALDDGGVLAAHHLVLATGTLSIPSAPRFPGQNDFQGEIYHTGLWPHDPVSFCGKRVGVIGTGSSGMQIIPHIAEEAAHLTVFQRTPQYSLPAQNHALDADYMKEVQDSYGTLIPDMWKSRNGFIAPAVRPYSALSVAKEERDAVYQDVWDRGISGVNLFLAYDDILTNDAANETVAEFLREKIRAIVKDPETARKLTPDYPFGGKRVPKDSGFFEAFNRDNVTLVDLREAPLEGYGEHGLRVGGAEVELDMVVLATGYDAMTGPLTNLRIEGRGGQILAEKWRDAGTIETAFGIAHSGFPNLYTMAGPLGPGVSILAPIVNEFIADWIVDAMKHLRARGLSEIEATNALEAEWKREVLEHGGSTVFAKVDSWYNGANMQGKLRDLLIYLGGLQNYRAACTGAATRDYAGFQLS